MTEPKVVRYKIHAEQYEQKSASGLWVRYSDYEALAARVEELEAARNRHLKQARSLAKTLKDTSVSEYAAKLEAENKRLREDKRRALIELEYVMNDELDDPKIRGRCMAEAMRILQEPTDD